MSVRSVFIGIVCFMCACASVRAADRQAHSIDFVALDLQHTDVGDSLGGLLWGETALRTPGGDWCVLFGGGYSRITSDRHPDADYWKAGLGLKRYLTGITALSAIAWYGELDLDDRPRTIAGELTLKQRLAPADEPVSPYLKAGATLREVEIHGTKPPKDDYTEVVATLGAGCEFHLTRDCSLVFEAAWNQVEGLSNDGSSPNWLQGMVAMQYYWK